MALKDHLSKTARNRIRYHLRATEQGIARKYGISVAQVREIRATAQPDHPARVAALRRRFAPSFTTDDTLVRIVLVDRSGNVTGSVNRTVVPATEVAAPKGQLHVEGGVDLPVPLA